MPIPEKVAQLVERFIEHREDYQDPGYKEARLRIEFLDDLFEALGWDVSNNDGYSEAYKDVVVEDSLLVEGMAKAPDYTFRIGGQPKFYVEAKKPSINLKDDPEPALQLRRYAWTAGMSLSILTDFEELAVYDTRIEPKPGDQAHVARLLYFTVDEYADRWDELAGIFSKEAILHGAFDKYAASTKTKKGTAPVDAAILKQIEGWRKAIAKDAAANNKKLDQRELNIVVQQTIDRILFLRISEDRGVEKYGALREAAEDPGVYTRLFGLFRNADNKYNSGLFYFRSETGRAEAPDTLTPSVKISDKPLRQVISELYWPKSRYVFKALPADILGQVYEQFLGKTVTLTASRRVKVEDKPEVRKAGGVYYTPTHVVQYIVKQAIEPLLGGKTPTEASLVRIVDPACGSGSFLLQAYQFLLDWHLDWYHNNEPDKWAKKKNPPIYQVRDGQWRLTTYERKRILLNNIYGVDVDLQAVEVTKLSLLLKVLEGETRDTISNQLTLLQERALPDLGYNIKCGNSIIAPDYLDSGQFDLLDEEEIERVNVFSWKDGFPAVAAAGGFGAVIGNPPYVLLQSLNQPTAEKYLKKTYEAARYKIDTYHVFLERGIKLLREGGRLGYITPTSFLRNKHALNLRAFILRNTEVEVLRVFFYPIFRAASVDTCVTVMTRRAEPDPAHAVTIARALTPAVPDEIHEQPQSAWSEHPKMEFTLAGDPRTAKLLGKIGKNSVPLGGFATAYFGIQTFDRDAYVAAYAKNGHYKPVVDGTNISRYGLTGHTEYVAFRPKAIKSGGNPKVYAQERIGVRQIGQVPIATILPAGLLTLNTIYNIYFTRTTPYSLPFVLGVISSTVVQWFWRQMHFDQKKTFPKIKKEALLSIPLPKLDFTDRRVKETHHKITSHVEDLLELNERLSKARTANEREGLRRRAEALDGVIDRLISQLYGLTDEEVASLQPDTAKGL